MKKFLIILLMLVYGISSSGMTINLHYCCGKLDGISFLGKQDKGCEMGNHLKKSSCCNDKQISAKLNADQQSTAKWLQVYKQLIAAPVYSTSYNLFTNQIVTTNRLARGTPVPIFPVPIFIKNCVFRI
jgi:hypothetical protein